MVRGKQSVLESGSLRMTGMKLERIGAVAP